MSAKAFFTVAHILVNFLQVLENSSLERIARQSKRKRETKSQGGVITLIKRTFPKRKFAQNYNNVFEFDLDQFDQMCDLGCGRRKIHCKQELTP